MTEPSDQLDRRLDRLFGAVQLSADFDARLMARVHVETDSLERIEGDYRRGMLAASGRRRRLLRFLTLDMAAVVALLIFGELMLMRMLLTVPAAVKNSAVWHAVSSDASPALGMLVLIPIAVIAAILWTVLDYGRSPE